MNLSYSHVTVDYDAADGTTLRALENFSLQVEQGEPVAVIGPSGCGKSTLLRLTAGLMAPTHGHVLADSVPLTKPRKETAYILQDFGLLPWKNVYSNAELGLRIHKVPEPERRERTLNALAAVGLSGFEHSFPRQLSGGMQQRLALARALALDVDLLLMDEPLSALDALLREELQNTLLELWKQRGHSQILVTHSIEEAVFLGRRIVVMAPRPGRVVAQIENPDMGAKEYRNDPLFFQRCRQVRAALAQGGSR